LGEVVAETSSGGKEEELGFEIDKRHKKHKRF
jgi:hypothetical protein